MLSSIPLFLGVAILCQGAKILDRSTRRHLNSNSFEMAELIDCASTEPAPLESRPQAEEPKLDQAPSVTGIVFMVPGKRMRPLSA